MCKGAPIRTVFFDAAGTLFSLRESVGHGYAAVARRCGFALDVVAANAAFEDQWKRMSPYNPGKAEPDDGKSWWRTLVFRLLDALGDPAQLPEGRREDFFEALYSHYALPEQWIPFPETIDVLRALKSAGRHQLGVISNFDRRVYGVLDGLGIRGFLDEITISTEIGFSKPHGKIFSAACERAGTPPGQCLHAGDDPEEDWAGARDAGLRVFRLDREKNSLEDVVAVLA